MGYVRKKILLLKFDDPEFEGLEVRVRQASMEQICDYAEFGKFEGGTRQQMARVIDMLAAGVISWNLEEPTGETTPDGEDVVQPVPCTPAGMWTQDGGFIADIFKAWMRASAGVSGPLGPSSSVGEPSLEASIPMNTPSENPPSSPTPN
jgi:hypothetical protein